MNTAVRFRVVVRVSVVVWINLMVRILISIELRFRAQTSIPDGAAANFII